MDEAKKKQVSQLVILGVLLVGVVVAVMFTAKKTAAPTKAPASKVAATNMASAGLQPSGPGGATSVPSQTTANASKLNPNMWKVYSLTPPKSPFVQQESWYAATFRKFLPGYPNLKEYFNKPGDVLPDVNHLFGDKINFDEFDLRRTFRSQDYKLEGTSDDGLMQTTVGAHVAQPDDVDVKFDKSGNKIMAPGPTGGPNIKLDGKTPKLPPLGGTAPPVVGEQGEGGDVTVTGVSFHNGRASALVHFNGSAYIVHEGGSVPPRFSNAHIKDNGVQFKDIQTGKTRFVELKPPSKEDDLPAVMRGRRTVTQS